MEHFRLDDHIIRCLVRGCESPAAITDTTVGAINTFRAHYCSSCYEKLVQGAELPVEPDCLEVVRTASAHHAVAVVSNGH